ncbi:MAG: hypothetical protein H7A52_11155 [Akkermansiaceae bacterium]|nr:hypothetical protein [Akkermansiaceae bacterium]
MSTPDTEEIERAQAWIGDAVLALCARRWILARRGAMDGALQARMTSNQFLSAFGNPTAVEARIGRIYEADGLEAAFAHIEETLFPLVEKQEKNRGRRR